MFLLDFAEILLSMKIKHVLSTILIFLCLPAAFAYAADTVDLKGEWRFALDPSNKGVAENWFDQSLTDKISLPGVLQSQGFGNEISTSTPWVLSLYDHYWFDREVTGARPDAAAARIRGQVNILPWKPASAAGF